MALDCFINAYLVKDPHLRSTLEKKSAIAFQIACCFKKLGNKTDAIHYFQESIYQFQKNGHVFYKFGLFLLKNGLISEGSVLRKASRI